jgi:hypothetical protein
VLLNGIIIFFFIIMSIPKKKNPAKKKYAADSFLYSPRTFNPSKELNGKKNNPIKNKIVYIFLIEIIRLFLL